MDVPLSISNPPTQDQARKQADGLRFKTLSDYKVAKEIGDGSFATVYLATEKSDRKREVALKVCLKKHIIKHRKIEYVQREKQVLALLSTAENQHHAIVSLFATFQDAENLYFVLSYAQYGDLLRIMLNQENEHFILDHSKYYSAVLLSALEHIHRLGIIHRDVKPENILMKSDKRIILSDFGTAKMIDVENKKKKEENEGRRRRNSFVGTAQYVLHGEDTTPASDFWSFGVVVYQFLTGKHVFHDESEYLIFKRVEGLLYKFPDDFDSAARDLVEKLLVLEPSARLGTGEGAKSIRSHKFFDGISWETLATIPPPDVKLH
ncbi:unnamed protein product [Caenorhabditis auriculariae]|uniref:non-specific serine/threonine protein kinase n=1 Tax=Caenorhabditis auriculariae TaxID=2777116 RepID=A0A8S1H4Y7_9PELO|nr:unnamed protein product [Caenorhabditis auriculariae]